MPICSEIRVMRLELDFKPVPSWNDLQLLQHLRNRLKALLLEKSPTHFPLFLYFRID